MAGVELITGGWFASAVIGKVVDLGRSYLGDNYDLHTGTREMLTNLESHLPHIQTVIEEAEKKQITSRGLVTWLEQLKDAASEAEDVLDDFEAKRIRDSIKGKGKVTEIASSSVRMVKTLIFSNNDFKKLKSVVKKLDKLCMGDLINTLQLTQSDKRKEHLGKLGSETSSNLAPGVVIFGRDREIGLILDIILNVLYVEIYHQSLDDHNLQQGEVDPNLQEGEVDPNLQQEEVDPNLQHGEVDPNLQQGEVDPNSQRGEVYPNLQQGEVDPNLQEGEVDPNLQQEEVDPNLQHGEVDPNLQQGEVDPNSQRGEVYPNLQEGEVDPNLQQEEVDPNLQQGEVDPNLQQKEVDPNLQEGEVDPNLPQGEVVPNLQQGEVDPNLQQGEVDPNLQQGRGEGNSSLWGLHAIPITVRSLVGFSKYWISKLRETVKKWDAPEGSEQSINRLTTITVNEEPDYDYFEDSLSSPPSPPSPPSRPSRSSPPSLLYLPERPSLPSLPLLPLQPSQSSLPSQTSLASLPMLALRPSLPSRSLRASLALPPMPPLWPLLPSRPSPPSPLYLPKRPSSPLQPSQPTPLQTLLASRSSRTSLASLPMLPLRPSLPSRTSRTSLPSPPMLSSRPLLPWRPWRPLLPLRSSRTSLPSPPSPPSQPLLPSSLEESTMISNFATIVEPHSISNRKLAVITIVGVGGIGKTAVAKKVYNNEGVKEHFSFKAWVYVSENCHAKKIMQDILCSIGWDININPLMNLENVGNILKETLRNRRFLIVLDDLRDMKELKWHELRSVLCYGEVGSVVVVTTQSKSIANTIRTLPEVTLDVLQPETYWELFQHYAFGGFKLGDLNDQPPLLPSKQEKLKKIGKQIAERLHGLPLAGVVIGTLLSTKLEKEFWEDIRRSDWWNIEGARENILPSIGVGYNYLDMELKQCFVFCSIFPKHYVFERERLVQMWIAHGFIQPSKDEASRLDKGDIRLEDIGRKWFGKLVDRSFLQPTVSDGKYVMHDLVRDLAIAISSNDFCFVKSHDQHLPSLARHLGIDCDSLEVELKCENSTRVRTMLFFGNWTNCSAQSISNIFGKNNGLRVLDLSHIMLLTNEPINVVCQLSHLRFVDLSFTGIKSIPDELCALCHLEVLDVRGCNFEKLPEGMNKLVNLRHLYASSDTISLISKIGKLTKLQELEEFHIGESKGHRISELKEMNEISGHLLLSNVDNVSSKEAAAKAQLEKKKFLKSLELKFVRFFGASTNEVKMEVLNALKPACSLEILKFWGCIYFPDWLFLPHHDFNNLKVIHVRNFWSSSLPAFGELPSLELLSFDYLPSIEKIGCEFYGSSNEVFPSLKELTFSRMRQWRDWSDAEAGKKIFPHLKKFHLEECNVLYKLPTNCFTSSVEAFILSRCYSLCIDNIQTVLQRMPSLAHLSITKVCSSLSIYCTPFNSLEVINLCRIKQLCFVGGLKSLVNLRKLVITDFHEILESDELEHENEEQCLQFLNYLHLSHDPFSSSPSLPIRVLGRLSSLRTLLIEKYSTKEYTSEEESWFNQLKSLKKLEFRTCLYLTRLPSQLHLLTSLKKLHIYDCHQILSLPENGLPQNLAELYIEHCSKLIPRCQPNEGDDWHKISHIPFVHLEYYKGN